ncbi:phage major capsid protein, HK97 family [Clostridium sp. USBA 49]|uniref:phage major capsid protein n=1 Tax=Clostridium sp. USBA 49 TaxID=1881060 RepID=UPI00099B0085|nr:phage major capsid protein [Clostridium sp. USBA 49]SKA89680.1 phage major capsid protein, HK97 family [Clostridium sp. USBA 49]
MTKQEYLNKRKVLLAEAQNLINDGKINESTAKMAEIEALDNHFEESAKSQANLNALNNVPKAIDIINKGVSIEGGQIVDSLNNDLSINNDDLFNSLEYRKAFMNNVLKGTPIPAKFINDANTTTGDVGSVIPTTVLEKIIEKLESTGMILPLVTRTAYQGGVSIPISSVKPVATWVSEGSGSDKQKKTTGVITFNYFKLRCAVSISFETSIVTLSVFETTIINNIAEAMGKALEQSIINGDGIIQPKGILKENVFPGQNIEIAADKDVTYNTLVDAEAALPLAYESDAVWCMTKKTFMKFIGMLDNNGQPIARINYGINGKPERILLGRTVVLNEYMPSLGTAIEEDTVVAFLFSFKDYVLNTNYNITMKKYEDNDTDDQVTKAIMLVDGKVVDKNSLVTITKKAV